MLKRRIGIFIANIIALLCSFLFTYVLRFGWMPDEPAFFNVNEALVLTYLLFSFLVSWFIYRPKTSSDKTGVFQLVKHTFITTLLMAAVFTTIVYTAHISENIPRLFFGYFFVIFSALSFTCSLILYFIEKSYVNTHRKKTVLFTDEKDPIAVARHLLKSDREDFEIIGIVNLKQTGKGTYNKVSTSSSVNHQKLADAGLVRIDPDLIEFELEELTDDYLDYLKKHRVDQIILSVERLDRDKIRDIIDSVGEMGIESMMTMDSLAVDNFESMLEDFGTLQVIKYAPRLFSDGELFWKRVIDIIGALVGCTICIIIGIFIAPIIYLTDRGPVIFKQKRVGKNGKYFEIYKFRSMYVDAEERRKELMKNNEMDGAMFKIKDDPRITPIGRFIRKTSLDEFPQFFNVLKGDMSLVGTRPPMVDEYETYSLHHKRRLSLKPGITGLWQVSGRSKITDFEEVVRLDCYYIDHWSILYDIKILLMTIGAVLTGKGSE
ncbi:MAG: sugar transferase [Candidatus Saccharibacteria bacterium]|nr:sugar transferase [Candidatus Saccharibacteria bacterium]